VYECTAGYFKQYFSTDLLRAISVWFFNCTWSLFADEGMKEKKVHEDSFDRWKPANLF